MLLKNIEEKLTSLKLRGMLSALNSMQEDPSFKKLSFYEKLGYLIDEEYSYQEDLSLSRKIKLSKFKVKARIEEINYKHRRGLRKDQMLEIGSCKWAVKGTNVIITGPTGVGKTYLSCAIGEKCCRVGFKVKYYRASRLLQEIALAKMEGKWSNKLKQINRFEVIILDDWGLWELTESGKRDLLEVIDDRSATSSTIISTQVPVSEWHELLGGDNIADAILDRLVHNSIRITLIGESMRKIQAKEIKK